MKKRIDRGVKKRLKHLKRPGRLGGQKGGILGLLLGGAALFSGLLKVFKK